MNVPDDLREALVVVLRTIDAITPAIEAAIKDEWDKGNYINAPQFGGALEELHKALAQGTAGGAPRREGGSAPSGAPSPVRKDAPK